MSRRRHAGPPRVTPELIAFHAARAREMRREAMYAALRMLGRWLRRLIRGR